MAWGILWSSLETCPGGMKVGGELAKLPFLVLGMERKEEWSCMSDLPAGGMGDPEVSGNWEQLGDDFMLIQ